MHGESVEGHLLLLDEGCRSKVTGAEGVQRLGGRGRPGTRVVGHGP